MQTININYLFLEITKNCVSKKGERKRCSAGLETQVRRRVLKKIGRGEIISYLYLLLLCILIPMVRCCIYISHSFNCGSFVLFVILPETIAYNL